MTPEPSNSPKSLFDLVVAADFAATPRALWLFHAACARRVADVLPDDNARSLIELTEQVADGVISIEQWGQAAYEVIDPYVGNERARDGAGGATFGLLMHLYPGEARATRHVAGSVIEARAYRAATHGHPTAMTRDQWVAEAVADEEIAGLFRARLLQHRQAEVGADRTFRVGLMPSQSQEDVAAAGGEVENAGGVLRADGQDETSAPV